MPWPDNNMMTFHGNSVKNIRVVAAKQRSSQLVQFRVDITEGNTTAQLCLRGTFVIFAPSPDCVSPRVDSKWMSISLLKKWKTECEESHERCRKSTVFEQMHFDGPSWLIDLWNLCLVPAPDSSTYVALSYVWGSAKPLCTTKQNIKDFQVPGALNVAINMPLYLLYYSSKEEKEERKHLGPKGGCSHPL